MLGAFEILLGSCKNEVKNLKSLERKNILIGGNQESCVDILGAFFQVLIFSLLL